MARTPTAPPLPMQQPVAPPPQMMQQQAKLTLLEAISAASAGFGDLTKDSKNDYLKSQYLGLPGLLKAIKQPLLEQGVVIYTQLQSTQAGFVVRTTLALVDGEEELYSDFPITDASTMHKIGGAVTYGTRYNLLAMLAICPEKDDDGTNAVYGGNMPSQGLPGLPGGVGQMPPQQMQQPMMQQPPGIAHPIQPAPVLYQ